MKAKKMDRQYFNNWISDTYDDIDASADTSNVDVPLNAFVRLEDEYDVMVCRRLHLRPDLHNDIRDGSRLARTRVR